MRERGTFVRLALGFGFAFLYLPIALVVAYSFNDSRLVTAWGGFSLRWYGVLFHSGDVLDAALLSLRIATVSATGATVLGTLAGHALARMGRFRGRLLFTGLIAAPLVVPDVIIGLSLLLLFVSLEASIGWPAGRGAATIAIGHVTFSTAYVAVIVRSRLAHLDVSLEEAAMDLGGRPLRVLFDVTLPVISPAIAAAWLLAFTLSLDDLVIASFVSGPGATTLPMLIFSKVRLGMTPDVNALAAILIGLVAAGVAIAGRVLRRRGAARALLVLLLLAPSARAGAEAPADLAFTGGAVYTLDAARSWAQAVAVRGGRIVYVGGDAGARAFVGVQTRVVPLAGRMLLPGFQDAHVHPLSAGLEHGRCDLAGLASREAGAAKIRTCAAAQPGPWLVGSGWELDWFPAGSPDRKVLDELVPDRPAFFGSADGHSAWVNSRALTEAGIDAATPDPPSGRIERDPQTREPSGTLRESAAGLALRLLPKPTPEERRAGLRWALGQLVALGITAAQDADVGADDLAAYRDAERRGELPLRVVAALSTADAAAGLSEGRRGDAAAAVERLVALRGESMGPRLRPTAAKIFVDGVIETRTAAMLEPYLDRPGDRGEPRLSPEALAALVAALVRERFSVHLHAIGDRAVRMSLDALEAAGARRGAGGSRHQIAHLEVIHPDDLPRFRRLGVIALFQPLWAYADPYIILLTLPALGPERSRWIYPIGSALRAGAPIAFGSDWSVSSPDPLAGIQVALTREWAGGKPGPFLPEQAIPLDAALAAYTIGAATANGLDAETGSVEVGKLADLAVLSHDLFELPPARIATARVELTLVEGEPVYRAPGFAW